MQNEMSEKKTRLESAVLSLQLPLTNMHFSTIFTLALPAVVLAAAVPRDGGDCDTGSLQCCNSVQSVCFAALSGTISE